MKNITDLFNGAYHGYFTNKYFRENKKLVHTVRKKPTQVRLSYNDDDVQNIVEQRLKNEVKKTFQTTDLIIVDKTCKKFPPSMKDVTSVLGTSKLFYELTRICESKFIGWTKLDLSNWIKEHSPILLINSVEISLKSTITKHLLDSKHSINVSNSHQVIIIQANFQIF